MIVGYRAWGVRRQPVTRQVQTGTVKVPLPRRGGVEPWVLGAGEAPRVLPLAELDFEVLELPEVREEVVGTHEVLVGLPGTPREYAYQPGRNQASCANHPFHQPPVDHDTDVGDPGCGFYAVKTLDLVTPADVRPTLLVGAGGCLCALTGLVGLSGEVTEGPNGYRGQHARVLALFLPPALAELPHYQARGEDPAATAFGWLRNADPCGCGTCLASLPVAGDPSETVASHQAGLADYYQVPVFTTRAELEAYAAEVAVTPDWPVDPVPPPQASEPPFGTWLPAPPGVPPPGFAFGGYLQRAAQRLQLRQSALQVLSAEELQEVLPRPRPGSTPWWGAGRPPPGVQPARRPGRQG